MNYRLSKNSTVPVKQIVDSAINEARERFKAGEDVEIVIKKADKNRTSQQNKYFHGLVGILAKHAGYEPDRLKVEIKYQIGLIEKVLINGEVITSIKSTAQLNTEDFGKLIDTVQNLLDQMGVTYPLPNEQGYDFKT